MIKHFNWSFKTMERLCMSTLVITRVSHLCFAVSAKNVLKFSLFYSRSYKSGSGVNNRRTELFLKEHDHLRK